MFQTTRRNTGQSPSQRITSLNKQYTGLTPNTGLFTFKHTPYQLPSECRNCYAMYIYSSTTQIHNCLKTNSTPTNNSDT